MIRNGRDARVPMAGRDRCLWYSQIYIDGNQLVHDAQVGGSFYSKELSEAEYSAEDFGGDIEAKATYVTLQTNDFVDGLKVNDSVMFKGELYLVISKKSIQFSKSSPYAINPPNTTTIRLKR